MTRSKAKKVAARSEFSLVPLPVKIVKLVLEELAQGGGLRKRSIPRSPSMPVVNIQEEGGDWEDGDYNDIADEDDDEDDDDIEDFDDDEDEDDEDDDEEDDEFDDDDDNGGSFDNFGRAMMRRKSKSPFAPAEDYQFLSDVLYMDENLDENEEELEDDAIKLNPLFAAPLEETLGQFVSTEVVSRPGAVATLEPHLTQKQQKVLRTFAQK